MCCNNQAISPRSVFLYDSEATECTPADYHLREGIAPSMVLLLATDTQVYYVTLDRLCFPSWLFTAFNTLSLEAVEFSHTMRDNVW